jgi:phosphoglucomutase/phosphomannomutase
MARAAGAVVIDDLLVGFKHHAGIVAERSEAVLFACEESHGYLRGREVRDKDGAVAALLLCEAAADARLAGTTLQARLRLAWERFGYHRERTVNLRAAGRDGEAAIAHATTTLRRAPPARLGGLGFVSLEDRRSPRATGSATRDLPGDVVVLEYADPGAGVTCRVVLRPSGTEPKLKLYGLAAAPPGAGADLDAVILRVDGILDELLRDAERVVVQAMGLGGA